MSDANPSVKLLRIIGSPFEAADGTVEGPLETKALLDCAAKNKVALLYLGALKKRGSLSKFHRRYTKERAEHEEFKLTLVRATQLLNKLPTDYVVIKTMMPYPATPNDVDVLLLKNNYYETIEGFLMNNYELIGEAPHETWLHDSRNGHHKNPKKKDVYDVDLYKEVGASHLIYLQREHLRTHKRKVETMNCEIKILAPEAELPIILFHSIFPEQIFTLSHFYSIIYHLHGMSSYQIESFLKEVWKNNIVLATRAIFGIGLTLYKAAFSTIPESLRKISAVLRVPIQPKCSFTMPYKYSFTTLFKVLSEKLKEQKYRKSAMNQAANMLNLGIARYLLLESIERRRRESY